MKQRITLYAMWHRRLVGVSLRRCARASDWPSLQACAGGTT